MQLSPVGARAATFGAREKQIEAQKLIRGQANISAYTNGVCCDTVAYIRYLLGANITSDELEKLVGQTWDNRFQFTRGTKWDGSSQIPEGTAVGFYRHTDKKVFHAAIGVGNSTVRAVNGGLLGAGWQTADLKQVLGHATDNGSFNYDGTTIDVFLSQL